MSRNSRRFAGAALFAAWMSIPAVAQAQAGTAERSLMNRVAPELRSQVGKYQSGVARGIRDQALAARALMGTTGELRYVMSNTGSADAGFPSAELALTGRPASSKIRMGNR